MENVKCDAATILYESQVSSSSTLMRGGKATSHCQLLPSVKSAQSHANLRETRMKATRNESIRYWMEDRAPSSDYLRLVSTLETDVNTTSETPGQQTHMTIACRPQAVHAIESSAPIFIPPQRLPIPRSSPLPLPLHPIPLLNPFLILLIILIAKHEALILLLPG